MAEGGCIAVLRRPGDAVCRPRPQCPLFNVREGYGSGMVPGVAEIIVHQVLLIGIGVILGSRRQRNGGRRLSCSFTQWTGMLAGFACMGLPALLYYAGFTFWGRTIPMAATSAGRPWWRRFTSPQC